MKRGPIKVRLIKVRPFLGEFILTVRGPPAFKSSAASQTVRQIFPDPPH
jgi:hypothetical protein